MIIQYAFLSLAYAGQRKLGNTNDNDRGEKPLLNAGLNICDKKYKSFRFGIVNLFYTYLKAKFPYSHTNV